MEPKRKRKPHKYSPTDKDYTRTQRSAKRVADLNALAKEAGFESWRKLETAALKRAIKITKVDEAGNEKL
jgi:hypothetical protein